MLEVCIDSLESAVNAIHGGADELEVCSSLAEGGLTPSAGLVKEVLVMVNNISDGKAINKSCRNCNCEHLKKRPKINVMIRCRTGPDFCYTEYEMATMLADIEFFKQMDVDRFVFGALNSTQDIDEVNCSKVVDKARPIPVTFHRAIDTSKDPINSIKNIVDLGFKRVLTSGRKPSAGDLEAIKLIKTLVELYGDKIEIMPGAGVNSENAKLFIDMGCKIVHSSCKKIRHLPRVENKLAMGTSDGEFIYVTDENIVRKTKKVLSS